jgi:glycosyltransferase involved in cell wall biosynthesis
MRDLALIVPEYRTPQALGGGLAAVADFVAAAFDGAHVPERDRWRVRIVSPRMYHAAAVHRSPRRPASLLRPVGTVRRQHAGRIVHEVGTTLPELEPNRYRPRAALTRLVDACDAAVVIAGTPAIGNVMRDTTVPWVLKVATLVEEERAGRLATTSGLDGALLRWATRRTDRLDRTALTLPDAVVTLNTTMGDRLRTLTDVPVHVLPTGVDTDLFTPPTRRAADGPILMVSRLNDPRKDIPTLLRAYACARRSGLDRPLVLAGRHTLSTGTDRVIDDLGLRPHVRVVESPSDADLAELMRSASGFALTSREEGLGVVFLEAMASGLPVVTTATRGARHAVPDRAGWIVPFGPELVEDVAEALLGLVRDPVDADARGAAGRAHVLERFALRPAEAQWRSLLETVLAEGRVR